jgi:putative redox protein
MPLTASAHSAGDDLRQDVLIRGRHHLVTDEPLRLGGSDLGPAPHELLPAALAACIATTMRMYARTKQWDLGELTVDVVYDHQSTPRHFDVSVHLPGDLTAEQTRRLMRAAEACPVRRAIEAGMTFDEHLAETGREPRFGGGRITAVCGSPA